MPETMTGVERMIKTIQGEIPDRVPVLPQSFWFSANHCGVNMAQYRASGESIAETLMNLTSGIFSSKAVAPRNPPASVSAATFSSQFAWHTPPLVPTSM